jgi:lipid-binding SYLF domain-containing protein
MENGWYGKICAANSLVLDSRISQFTSAMKSSLKFFTLVSFVSLALVPGCANGPTARINSATASASQISTNSRAALRSLYAQNPAAKALGEKARGILVFPSITRAGFIFGGQAGNGAMIRDTGEISGFYQTTSVSYGLQAGAQQFGYALFIMDDKAFADLHRTAGFDVGTSPSLVVVNRGVAAALNTTTINSGIYAFFFDQRGLMAGLGLQGTKITRIHPQN